VLDHRILDEAQIECAVASPPVGGRAERRGQLIQQFAGKPRAYEGEWTHIRDRVRERTMKMEDPFSRRRPRWSKGG